MTAATFDYRLKEPEKLLTPCLLVYPERIQANLREMLRIAGGVDRLRPHVKTHKTPQIVRMALDEGIYKHKCATLVEAQMLAECKVPDVLVAYQPVGPAVGALLDIVQRFPETRFTTIVEDTVSAKTLSEHVSADEIFLDVLVDIDTGMHRTGIPPGPGAVDLCQLVEKLPGLQLVGLHVYDGQNHQSDVSERRAAVQQIMQQVSQLLTSLRQTGIVLQKLVCGGTPTFPLYAELDGHDGAAIECSPGTCVLSDFNYGSDYADLSCMQHAALLMTRVVSKQHANHLTLDLGNKAIAADPPAGRRCHFLDLENVTEKKQNEEHLIIETDAADKYSVGDVLYVVPAHICPTVALHREIHAVRDGMVEDTWSVTARHRLYRVGCEA